VSASTFGPYSHQQWAQTTLSASGFKIKLSAYSVDQDFHGLASVGNLRIIKQQLLASG
jgi:hypothetical protein